MSIFNDLLSKISVIQSNISKSLNDELKSGLAALDKFEEDYRLSKGKAQSASQKNKNTLTSLQSIHEDDVEPAATALEPKSSNSRASKNNRTREPSLKPDNNNVIKHEATVVVQPAQQLNNVIEPTINAEVPTKRLSKKRSKDEVDISSPEQDKRPKRNASVRAQSVISKQLRSRTKELLQILNENDIVLKSARKLVNVNLTSKMRRDEPSAKPEEQSSSRRRGEKDDGSDKENNEPLIQVAVKQEKISIPPEVPTDIEPLPIITLKVEFNKDDIVMPPPVAPGPKSRGRPAKVKPAAKEKEDAEESGAESTGRRSRATRTKKQTDAVPSAPAPLARSTRASSRASSRASTLAREMSSCGSEEAPPQQPRPKRTRAKKKASLSSESEKETAQDNATPDKPRPKRTRKAKAAQKEEPQKVEEPPKAIHPTPVSTTEERVTEPTPNVSSPLLSKSKETKNKTKSKLKTREDSVEQVAVDATIDKVNLEETRVITTDTDMMNVTVNICNGDMDKTVTLPNGHYNDLQDPPNKAMMNETVVIDTNAHSRETFVLEMQPAKVMDCTVVIDKVLWSEKDIAKMTRLKQPAQSTDQLTNDSLLTDDNSEPEITPPKSRIPVPQPLSAVKEKVQQFEQLASRVTRTKTRAMANKDDAPADSADKYTPPDKMFKPGLSADTLDKMNNLIFNGKPAQVVQSASKPLVNVVSNVKSFLTSSASASKASSMALQREAAEELKRQREDARKKKEAILEAKKEAQRRKREEKMAAAAAAREAAERERRLAIEAAAKERMEKQAHADLGRQERLKEAERKRQELARKVAETEERRRAEERARQQRLADEQRRAELARRKQCEEQEATKKEAALMAKEIEKRQKEYIEKQKRKQRMESDKSHTPLGNPAPQFPPPPPVHMQDGFELLNSDEDEDTPPRRHPPPPWCVPKVRLRQLTAMSHIKQYHIDQLFSVRRHCPDLRQIFPNIDRRALKRTSSAVWRTPPARRLQTLAE